MVHDRKLGPLHHLPWPVLNDMSETRITVVFAPSSFDLWIPCNLRLVTHSIPESTVIKSIVHEYILLPDYRLNLKLAQDGKAYDLKFLTSSEEEGLFEVWEGCAKGSLPQKEGATSDQLLHLALETALTSAAPGSKAHEGLSAALVLFRPGGSYPRVKTLKTNVTCKGPSVTLEQINFEASIASGSTRLLRSFSVEGESIDKDKCRALLATVKAIGGEVFIGGFPQMLAAAFA